MFLPNSFSIKQRKNGMGLRKRVTRSLFRVLTTLFIGVVLFEPHVVAGEIVPAVTEASMDISSSGAASYSIPIKVTPGTAGIQPAITLQYNSQARNSAIGYMGWSLSGLSSVTRGRRIAKVDGISKGVELTRHDALYLDGARLIPIRELAGGAVEYRTQKENGSRIIGYEFDVNGPSWLRVWTKAGLIIDLGKAPDSKIRLQDGKILTWAANRISDTTGNYMLFEYQQNSSGSYQLKFVDYTGHKDFAGKTRRPYARLKFNYKTIDQLNAAAGQNLYSAKSQYLLGREITHDRLLVSIVSLYRDRQFRKFDLSYRPGDTPQTILLTSIKESGWNKNPDQKPPTTFEYSNMQSGNPVGWSENSSLNIPTFSESSFRSSAYHVEDLNDDGIADLLFSQFINNQLEARFLKGTARKWVESGELKPTVPFVGGSPIVRKKLFTDLDGDKRPDLILLRDGNASIALRNSSDGWKADWPLAKPVIPVPISDRSEVFPIDANSDGKRDLLFYDPTADLYKALRQTSTGWLRDAAFDLSGGKVFLLDSNCDGSLEPSFLVNTALGPKLNAYQSHSAGWQAVSGASRQLPDLPGVVEAALTVADLNGDGCQDIVVSHRDLYPDKDIVFVASASGWTVDTALTATFPIQLRRPVDANPVYADFVDVDGNGRLDLIARNGVSADIFLQDSNGWVKTTQYTLPAPFLKAGQNAKYKWTNLTSDKRDDLIFFGPGVEKPSVWTLVGNQWVESADRVPPVIIAQWDKVDLGRLVADVDSDGLPDLVLPDKVYRNTKNGWVEFSNNPGTGKPRYAPPKNIVNEKGGDNGLRLTDINGDGRVDFLLAVRKGNGSLDVGVYVNKNGDWVRAPEFEQPFTTLPFASEKLGTYGVQLVDLNADGLNDVIYSYRTSKFEAQRGAFINERGTWRNAPEYVPCFGDNQTDCVDFAFLTADDPHFESEYLNPPRDNNPNPNRKNTINRATGALFVDLNGDGLVDILYHHRLHNLKWTQHSLGAARNQFHQQFPRSRLPPELVDARDGDISKFSKVLKGALINTGSGWRSDPSFANVLAHRLDGAPYAGRRNATNILLPYNLDLNNDSLIDLVFLSNSAGNRTTPIYINTGAGYVAGKWTMDPTIVPTDEGDPGVQFIDVNGDSRVDILLHRLAEDGGTSAIAFWLNTGREFARGDNVWAPPMGLARQRRGDQGVRVIDVNGDGMLDFVQSLASQKDGTKKSAWLNRARRTDMLTAIVDGLGNRFEIAYEAMTLAGDQDGEGAVYDNPGRRRKATDPARDASSYPYIPAQAPAYLVRETKSFMPGYARLGNGMTVKYRYGGFKVNAETGNPLGFAWRVEENPAAFTRSVEYFKQEEPFTGKSYRQESYYRKAAGTLAVDYGLLKSRETQWAVREKSHRPVGGRPFKTYQLRLTSAETNKFSAKGNFIAGKKEQFGYDGAGNVVETIVELNDGYKTTTRNQYSDDFNNWILARLIDSEFIKENVTGDREVRRACFEYDQKSGILLSETNFCGDPNAIRTDYKLDLFGNRVASSVNGNDLKKPRSSSTIFDQHGRFVTRVVNSLGHASESVTDEVSGLVVAASDPNGLETSILYDGFGHVISQTSPTGVVSKYVRRLSPQHGHRQAFVTHSVTETVGNLPPTTTFYDSGNRKIFVEGQAHGNRLVRQETYFRVDGEVEKSSTSYYADPRCSINPSPACDPYWTSYSYDRLGRVERIVNPEGEVLTKKYDGLTTWTIDPLGRKIRATVNNRGKPLEVEDSKGGILVYTYDVADRVVKTRNVDGTEIVNTFNNLGQRVRSSDPNLGVWNYTYNSLGELVSQQDAKGQITKFSYDVGGRLERKREYYADGSIFRESRWTFDNAPFAKGKTVSLTTSGDYGETYIYDKYSRVISTKTTTPRLLFIDSESTYVSSQELDEYGRVTRIIYPSGFAVRNSYDEFGNLKDVTNAESGESYWKAMRYDHSGRITKAKVGKAITKSSRFDPRMGYLLGTEAASQGGQQIHRHTYKYNPVGNLEQKEDSVAFKSINYGYDELDRLTRVSGQAARETNISYAANGNIKYRSGVGTYSYGVGGAVESVVSAEGKRNSYSYDANGNVITSATRRMEYTPNNRLAEVSSGFRKKSFFRYAPNGNRYFHDYYDGPHHVRTVYLGLYERIYEQGTPPDYPAENFLVQANERQRFRHYIVGGEGVVGTVDRVEWHFPVRHDRHFEHRATSRKPEHSILRKEETRFFLRDNLGSVTVVANEFGEVLDRMEYDVWGKRIGGNEFRVIRRGFTGHEHLDNTGLIHMNGRVFDPAIGRFLSADPNIQSPTNAQNFNRYSYVLNNPLKFTDPSGYFFKKLFKAFVSPFEKAFRWAEKQINKVGKWFEKNWRQVVIVIVAVAVTAVTAGAAGPIVAAMLGGFAAGGLGAALYGGDLSDILEAGFRGAVIAGISAGAMHAWGVAASNAGLANSSAGTALGHGVVSGGLSEIQGGRFMPGFLSGSFAHFASANINVDGIGGFDGDVAVRVSADAMIGGTGAVIGGGKFANGAVSGAFRRLIFSEYRREQVLSENSRSLAPEEIELAKSVFGDKIDYSKVKIVNGKLFGGQPSDTAMAPEGSIYFGAGVYSDNYGLPSTSSALQDLFIHEMTHAMQFQHGVNVFGSALKLHVNNFFGGPDPYKYQPGRSFRSYNVEQQGNVARDIFRGKVPNNIDY